MKFLIWFLTFFIYGLIRMWIKDAGIILGAIPSVILMTIFFFCAQHLCILWDEHKKRKERAQSISPKEDNLVDPTEYTSSIKSTKNRKYTPTSKQRYCKYCGGAVDSISKKCGKCGKQYFRWRIKGRTCLTIITIALVISLCFSNAYLYIRYHKETTAMTSQINELKAQLNERSYTIRDLRSEIAFFDEHIVFVSGTNSNRYFAYANRYHKFGCSYFDSSTFWAYNTKQAESKGYSPCPECCQ